MIDVSLNIVDLTILGILFLSCIIGWVRGITKELLSLVAWGASIYFTILLFPYARSIARGSISQPLMADLIASGALFILFFTMISVINYICSNFVKKSVLSSIDRSLGGIFGVARGAVILAILDIIVIQCFFTETPKCVLESKIRPVVYETSTILVLVSPSSAQEFLLSHMSQDKKKSLAQFVQDNVVEQVASTTENFEDILTKKVAKKFEQFENNEQQPKTSNNHSQTAEELASLGAKKKNLNTNNKKLGHNPVSRKGRNDMDRLLDQFDDIDD